MQNRATLGIFFLCLGILIFSLQDAVIKAVSGEYALTQVVSFRCLVSVPICFSFISRAACARFLTASSGP